MLTFTILQFALIVLGALMLGANVGLFVACLLLASKHPACEEGEKGI